MVKGILIKVPELFTDDEQAEIQQRFKNDDIEVILPHTAGEKFFEVEESVKLINPRIIAEGYKIGERGFTNYILHADDMVKA